MLDARALACVKDPHVWYTEILRLVTLTFWCRDQTVDLKCMVTSVSGEYVGI